MMESRPQAQLISFYELDGIEMAEATRLALEQFDQLAPEQQIARQEFFQVELSSGKMTEVPYTFKPKKGE
jgi:major membrane immunogen (membrane-anchored lipoprotein)